MSRTDGHTEKTAGTLENVARPDNLHWEVFVTPGIPIVTRDKPPGVGETLFQATASTLIYGVRDAVLVDAFMTVKQANALADWVAARGKNLTTIYITHGHGDHWFGVGTLLERFPNAKAVAMPNAVKVMRQNVSPEALEGAWKVGFPGQIPDRLVIAEELKGNVIDLEGQQLVAVELGHTDTDYTTCLHVPSIGLVVAGIVLVVVPWAARNYAIHHVVMLESMTSQQFWKGNAPYSNGSGGMPSNVDGEAGGPSPRAARRAAFRAALRAERCASRNANLGRSRLRVRRNARPAVSTNSSALTMASVTICPRSRAWENILIGPPSAVVRVSGNPFPCDGIIGRYRRR